MTAYSVGVDQFKTAGGQIELSLEMKSVNSKYLDLQIRSPRVYLSLDQEIGKRVRSYLRRGRVEIYINRKVLEGKEKELSVNTEQAQALKNAYESVLASSQMKDSVSLLALLQNPDWLQAKDAEIDLEEESKHLYQLLDQQLKKLVEVRKKEGAALEAAILKHRSEFGSLYNGIKNRSTEMVQDLRRRMKERLEQIGADQSFDPQRLEQEVTLWTARADYQEEVDRIEHHLETFDGYMKKTGEVGRRVEFILQELHRELNTTGSKCVDPKTTADVIEMKALIERIREQIQNVE